MKALTNNLNISLWFIEQVTLRLTLNTQLIFRYKIKYPLKDHIL